jgi:hypothetical protein
MYNLTNLTTAQTPADLFTFANSITSGILFGGGLFALWFIMLFSLIRWGGDVAFTVASWSCFLLGVLLAYGGFIGIILPLAFLVMAAFGSLYLSAKGGA